MGEIRKDYFLERYVIINPERAKRPDEFKKEPTPSKGLTPFSPGNEKLLPEVIEEVPEGENWKLRVVPNKFAIVKPEGPRNLNRANELFTWTSNYGYHEIVVEGREDGIAFAQLSPSLVGEAIRLASERVSELQEKEGIGYVAYFKNEGPNSGASINHPHSQIIATSIVPPHITNLARLHEELRSRFGFSPLHKILDYERGGPRLAFETKHFAVVCPYASRFPMEALVIPLRDATSYTAMSSEEREDLAKVLHRLLSRLASINASYNLEWMHAPETRLHWHLSLTPRLSIWAGYELETNIIVNPVPPENAASFYKEK